MYNKHLKLKILLFIILSSIAINYVILPGASAAGNAGKPCSMVRISQDTDAFLGCLSEEPESIPELAFYGYFETGSSGQLKQVGQFDAKALNLLHSKGIKIISAISCDINKYDRSHLNYDELADLITAAVANNRLDGINLSAAGFAEDNGVLFALIRKLRGRLGYDKVIVVNVSVKADNMLKGLSSYADLGRLSELSDYLLINPFIDYPGMYPSNTINQIQDKARIERTLQSALPYIPKSKLVFGVAESGAGDRLDSKVRLADNYGIKGVCFWNVESYSTFIHKTGTETETVTADNSKNNEFDKNAYLTFDDGPDGKITPKILDVLKEYNVKATFFINGVRAEEYPGIVRRIYNEGHTIGNHSYSHKTDSIYKSWSALKAEIEKTNSIIYRLTGTKCTLFRAPGGSKPYLGKEYEENIHKLGMKIFDWNCDPKDWKSGSDSRPILTAVKNTPLKKEMFIILHSRSDRASTLEALPQIIKYLRSKQYNLVPVSKATKEYIF